MVQPVVVIVPALVFITPWAVLAFMFPEMVLLFTVTNPAAPLFEIPPRVPPVTDPLENVTLPLPSFVIVAKYPGDALTPLQIICPVEVFRIPPLTEPGIIVPEVN